MRRSQSSFKILVPIDNNEHLAYQVAFAERLAVNMNAEIRYLHVLSSARNYVGSGTEVDKTYNLMESYHVTAMRDALTQIIDKQKEVSRSCIVFKSGVSVAKVIMEDANLVAADFILCGTGSVPYRAVPRVFSTVLSLMTDSVIPVIVTPSQSHVTLQKQFSRVLIADDMTEHCDGALTFAMAFTKRLSHCKIIHVNVLSTTREQYMQTFYEALNEYGILAVSASDPGELYDEKLKDLKRKLDQRLSRLDLNAELDPAAYETRLLIGGVDDLISLESDKESVDLVVFGRHQFFHSDPMTIGNLSFRKILQLRHPIVIVPSTYGDPHTRLIYASVESEVERV